MKMKEVCAATGLTERAVRFYVQEQLVSPQSQRRGGRTWLDFSDADVERLRAIGTLRKAGFTIDEIRSMGRDFQNNAPAVAFALRRRLQEAIDSYERLRRIDTAQVDDLEGYAALLEREVRGQPLPDSDRLECLVENSNFPKADNDRSGSGIGIQNLRRRLELLYPGKYSFQTGISGDRFSAHLIIHL